MMTHTPGPWHVREARWHEVAADAISDNGEEYELVIAQCDPAVQLLNNDSEIRANARLIAATPDLLAALERLVADVDAEEYINQTAHSTDDYDMAFAAIAKATQA